MRLTLETLHQSPTFTLGKILVGEEWMFTLELAWKLNQRNISCIPGGMYSMRLLERERLRVRLRDESSDRSVRDAEHTPNVDPRTPWERFNCDIHIANRTSELKGCIAVGNGFTWKDQFLTGSKQAMTELYNFLESQEGPSYLEVVR